MVQSDLKIAEAVEEQLSFEIEELKKQTREKEQKIGELQKIIEGATQQNAKLQANLQETTKAKEKLEEALKPKPPSKGAAGPQELAKPPLPEFDILERKKEIQKERRCSGQTAMYLAHREFLQKIREMADK